MFWASGLLINGLYWLNLVEWFKRVFRWARKQVMRGKTDPTPRALDTLATDIFVVAKWLLVAFALWTERFTAFWVLAVLYLLVMNLYTYFHYHAWRIMELTPYLTAPHIRRRMVNAILAIAYSMLSFGYLYAGPLRSAMGLAQVEAFRTEALIFSASNSLTVGYGVVAPASTWARATCVAQLVNMFLFGTIILAASLSSMFGASANNAQKG